MKNVFYCFVKRKSTLKNQSSEDVSPLFTTASSPFANEISNDVFVEPVSNFVESPPLPAFSPAKFPVAVTTENRFTPIRDRFYETRFRPKKLLDDFFTRELWKNVPPTTADK
jgi:hypothetical protein